ncbi:hypothetical protein KKC88_01200 [Patescibacteria group bacterium]|nr:hypothetical protein [Patescibacteria group bacterium]MBU1672848.1 hypothetical protein [Patescibacteria group bacterium]MBU1963731.1 hypothetical protein [Patescibacteria group bacterium]
MKKILLLAAVSAIVLAGCAAAPDKDADINSFEECAAAGYPIMESYPEQCMTDSGRSFTNEKQAPVIPPENPEGKSCEDLCGDGVCQEIVCMAIGCPCPETPENCPADCAK